MPISPEDVLSAESEGGSPLPLGGLPVSSAGFLGLVQEVVILLFYETSNKSEGAAANTQAKRRRRAVRDAAAHLVYRTDTLWAAAE